MARKSSALASSRVTKLAFLTFQNNYCTHVQCSLSIEHMRKRNRKSASPKRHVSLPTVERIHGVHAVCAALANPDRSISALFCTKNGLSRLVDTLGKLPVSPNEISPGDLSKRLGTDVVHQGVMIEAAPLPPIPLQSAIEEAVTGKPMIILDQVTDPHNVGAILRSAAAFNASALIMTRRNSPPLDGTLAKAASGALEFVPVILIANLARTLSELANQGVQIIGMEGSGQHALEAVPVHHPCALVLGAEHKGLRRLTAGKCNQLCYLNTPGKLKSLNVSNAAAIALHSVTQRSSK